MSVLENKVDFVALVSVTRANGNGDPLNGNRPRTDLEGYGEMSDVCIKRKTRNRMHDMGKKIFVETKEQCAFPSLKAKAEQEIGTVKSSKATKGKKKDKEAVGGLTEEEYYKKACELYLDVRSFGQLFAFKKDKTDKDTNDEEGSDSVSIGVRGPVTIHQAVSVSPVDIIEMQITKSINGNTDDNKGSDTMGMKHYVRFGLYEIKGSINVQLAEKTGFTNEDADTIKECLRTLFVNDASSARPEGSMEVVKLYWWKHNCKDGQYSSAKVHRSVKVALKNPNSIPSSADDYTITLEELPGLEPEIIDGI